MAIQRDAAAAAGPIAVGADAFSSGEAVDLPVQSRSKAEHQASPTAQRSVLHGERWSRYHASLDERRASHCFAGPTLTSSGIPHGIARREWSSRSVP
jgi:hypothetical protein